MLLLNTLEGFFVLININIEYNLVFECQLSRFLIEINIIYRYIIIYILNKRNANSSPQHLIQSHDMCTPTQFMQSDRHTSDVQTAHDRKMEELK